MKIWARIRQLSIGQLFKLSIAFLKRPLLIVPTIKATQRTFDICNNIYGTNHHKSNKENAFRHALWNVLICRKVLKKTKNKQESVFWAQKITDLYEKVTNNTILDEAMDLHNNAIGRICFLNHLETTETEIIRLLKTKAEQSIRLTSVPEMKNQTTSLVHLI